MHGMRETFGRLGTEANHDKESAVEFYRPGMCLAVDVKLCKLKLTLVGF